MVSRIFRLFEKTRAVLLEEAGQDLIEYALLIALIAFGATAGMNSLATGINTAFQNISSTLASSL